MNKLLLLLILFLLTACTGFQPVHYQFYTQPLPVVRYETYRPQFYYYQPRPYYVLPNYGGYPQGPRRSGGRR